jgi:hypothetical protein
MKFEGAAFQLFLLGLNVIVIIITGLIAFIANDLKATIKELKATIKEMVCEPVCVARMATVTKDTNNIGDMVRNHSHD